MTQGGHFLATSFFEKMGLLIVVNQGNLEKQRGKAVPTLYLRLGKVGGGFRKHPPLESSFPLCYKYILGIGKPPNCFRRQARRC